ncbi:aspartate/glutamate racemase family protein [Thiomonas intermedia]|uniref:aspartate/glutamate racemase family protein n=1 Tax=Thiomonas intermedia TaxID=926 RepID=UPI0009A4A4D7|nr:aspartate/glutamate racemase family protein [Thiomonas intermedia]
MKILIVNPNSTASMTAKIGAVATEVAAPGTTVTAVNPTDSPASIECHTEEALCVPGLLRCIQDGEAQGYDAYVIACFGDPGLEAARELAKGTVIGIAEAAMHAASLVAPSFSVVTTLARTTGMAWHLAERYGMQRFCKNVRAADVPVLDLEDPSKNARTLIRDECLRALQEDRSEAIVLGCAGMTDLCRWLSAELDVPVIDGVSVAVKFAESLATLGLKTSKLGPWAPPPVKPLCGLARIAR